MEIPAAKRRRTSPDSFSNAPSSRDQADLSPPLDGSKWQGWAEIESDPAFFTAMLTDLGVRGLLVKEVYSLDEEALASLPRPVYGIMFLFRWREDEEFVDTRFKAGAKVWFANQTVSNACASYALLNIVNNIPEIQLGPQLEHFREFTKDFTPSLRGDALSNFEFVKHIHNSFSRGMDKLNSDLFMKNQVDSSNTTRKKRSRSKKEENDDDAAHHFIAFMPVGDVLWKMDGLEWQPRSLGRLKCNDWLQQIKNDIESRMSRYTEGEIEFAILAVTKDPIQNHSEMLAVNVKSLKQISARVAELEQDASSNVISSATLLGPSVLYSLTEDLIEAASVPDTIQCSLRRQNIQELAGLSADLCSEQERLKREIDEEQDNRRTDESRVARRRHDAGEAIRKWLRHLVNRHMVKAILRECSL